MFIFNVELQYPDKAPLFLPIEAPSAEEAVKRVASNIEQGNPIVGSDQASLLGKGWLLIRATTTTTAREMPQTPG